MIIKRLNVCGCRVSWSGDIGRCEAPHWGLALTLRALLCGVNTRPVPWHQPWCQHHPAQIKHKYSWRNKREREASCLSVTMGPSDNVRLVTSDPGDGGGVTTWVTRIIVCYYCGSRVVQPLVTCPLAGAKTIFSWPRMRWVKTVYMMWCVYSIIHWGVLPQLTWLTFYH